MNLLATVAAYSVLFLLGESAFRLLRVPPVVTRPALHFACGVLSVLVPVWLTRAEIVGLALFFAVAMLVSMRMSLLRSIHLAERAGWGELFFPLGIALAALLYLPSNQNVYTLSLLVLAISDPLANVVGHMAAGRWGARLPSGKTVTGSLAFFASSILICLLLLPPVPALITSVALTVVEAVSPLGSDNLTIAAAGSVAALV